MIVWDLWVSLGPGRVAEVWGLGGHSVHLHVMASPLIKPMVSRYWWPRIQSPQPATSRPGRSWARSTMRGGAARYSEGHTDAAVIHDSELQCMEMGVDWGATI